MFASIPLLLLACSDVQDLDKDGYTSTIDCNDQDAAVHPGATEQCNGVDDDCDGESDAVTDWYFDGDADGYGDATTVASACDAPQAYVADATDCNDDDSAIHPGAEPESCDALEDQDCDGTIGGGDADGDGVTTCDDCDDDDASAYPGATELCDGVDNDCDGVTDGGVSEGITGYADADGDGYGDDTTLNTWCDGLSGIVDQGGDCDDTDAAVNPDGTEVCGPTDDDCDGLVDSEDPSLDLSTELVFYQDTDADGYGGPNPASGCSPPDGYTSQGGDCDDAHSNINPGVPEICGDGADENCNGLADDDDPTVSDGTTWYHDRDGDGVGGDDTRQLCTTPESGYTASSGDCDDTDATVTTGCTEPTFDTTYDVIVVGSGPAGMSAALSAEEMGATVLVVDKASQAGLGILAGQGLMAAGTTAQTEWGITDSPAELEDEWMSITGVDGHEDEVTRYVDATAGLLDWLATYGVTVSALTDRPNMGTVTRDHVIDALDDATGEALMVQQYTGDLWTDTQVTSPVMWEDTMVGVNWTDTVTGESGSVGAKAVVLATGGYQRDTDTVDTYFPELADRPWVWECILQADGGGENFNDLIGGQYINRESIGTYFHAFVDPYASSDHEALEAETLESQGLLVGLDGERFADETEGSDFGFYDLLPEGDVFVIVDGEVAESALLQRPFYNWSGSTQEGYSLTDLLGVSDDVYNAASLADLADQIGVDAAGLEATVEQFNTDAEAGATDSFGRDLSGVDPLDGDWYAVRMAVGIAKTFGGISTDIDTQVIDEDGAPIPGLYAAGEAAGFIPGGGSGGGFGGAVSAAYYGGRLAGQEAATWASTH